MSDPERSAEEPMHTQVEFRSSKFPAYDGEEEEINPGLWGKRLTEYLAQKLAERGIETEEFIVEDWGCYLPVNNEGFRLALCKRSAGCFVGERGWSRYDRGDENDHDGIAR